MGSRGTWRGFAERRAGWIVGLLLVVHAGFLAFSAAQHSPVWDEIPHLVSGMSHWRFGGFDLYRVNPPLVRSVAAIPVFLAGADEDWRGYRDCYRENERPKFGLLSQAFLRANGQRTFVYCTLARWACIPLSLVGGFVCFRWARDLYGSMAGVMAAGLWCFDPNILGHAQLLTPDVGATALGLGAAYCLWRWLRAPRWPAAFVAGLAMGLAALSKTTWIILFGLWPAVWCVWRWMQRRSPSSGKTLAEVLQLVLLLAAAIDLINLGYGFEGSFRRLGDHQFLSRALGGVSDEGLKRRETGNRFAGTWLGNLPVPLPANYVIGLDVQKAEFDRKKDSFLCGQWKTGGWWYYYLFGLLIKVPVGTWAIACVAVAVGLFGRGYRASWPDEVVLLVPPAVVLVLVSAQTGFSHHVRYVFPILPFAFVWMSKTARSLDLGERRIALLVAAGLTAGAGSSLWCYPHGLAYYNELIGGPREGHYYLGGSNSDWGQALLYLKRWMDTHPEARPVSLAFFGGYDPALAGYGLLPVPTPPEPGWHALSVNHIHDPSGRFAYSLLLEPAGSAGYSILIYHVTPEDVARMREQQASLRGPLPAKP
jgi:hypothetical protein